MIACSLFRVVGPAEAGWGLVMVMEHGRLLSSIREQAARMRKNDHRHTELRTFVDKETGLWGLEKGDEMLPDASFKGLSIKDVCRGGFGTVAGTG